MFDIWPYRHLYPFESHWLDRAGLRYHYLDEGVGAALLLVHGNPTWSFHFRELIKALRPSYRVIAPDHIGCGLSDKPGDAEYEYVLQRRVEDLEALCDHLELKENVTLVLHDWGGMIGLACALRKRWRIARIVLLNTAAFLLPPGKRLPWQLRVIRDTPLLPALLVRGLNAVARGATYLTRQQGFSAEIRAAYLAPYDSWKNRIATLRFVQDIPLRPCDRSYELVRWVDDHLATLRGVPMLICWGAQDFVFDAAILAEWQRRFPEAEVHTFPEAGHYVLEDVPQQIIPSVSDFLRRHPLPTTQAACTGGAS